MNLTQALPQPSPHNTRFIESLSDYGRTGEIKVIYDAGGPRFHATAAGDMADLHAKHRVQPGGIRAGLCCAAVEQLKQAIADHLAIINPIDND